MILNIQRTESDPSRRRTEDIMKFPNRARVRSCLLSVAFREHNIEIFPPKRAFAAINTTWVLWWPSKAYPTVSQRNRALYLSSIREIMSFNFSCFMDRFVDIWHGGWKVIIGILLGMMLWWKIWQRVSEGYMGKVSSKLLRICDVFL